MKEVSHIKEVISHIKEFGHITKVCHIKTFSHLTVVVSHAQQSQSHKRKSHMKEVSHIRKVSHIKKSSVTCKGVNLTIKTVTSEGERGCEVSNEERVGIR